MTTPHEKAFIQVAKTHFRQAGKPMNDGEIQVAKDAIYAALADLICVHEMKRVSGHASGYPFSPVRCIKCGYEP